MRVGLNLTGAVAGGTAAPFRNHFKLSSWGPVLGDQNSYHNIYPHTYPAVDSQGVAIPLPTFDLDGYLTNGTGQGRFNDQVIFYGMSDVPPGVHKLRADGDGDFKIVANEMTISGTFANRAVTTLNLPNGLTGCKLQLMRTNPADHVRNIQWMLPGYGFDDPLYLNDDFIASISGFPILRLMDWMETNGDYVGEWAGRPRPTAQTYSDDNRIGGVPYETFGELARRTGADLWLNIPHRASDDYVNQFGAYLLATLPPATTLYVEYGNELWNSFTFLTAQQTGNDAVASGLYPGISVFEAQNRYAARRARQVTMLMQRAFGGQAARIRPLFATQVGATLSWGLDEWTRYGVDPGVTTRPSAPLAAPNPPPYAGAVANYLGADLASPDRIAATKAAGIDGILAELNGRCLSTAAANAAQCRSVAATYGTGLLVYEGGFENFAAMAVYDADMVNLSIAASRDPRMGPAAAHLLGVAANAFDTFMWFSHCSPPTNFGQYGLLESIFPTPATSPRYATVRSLAVGGDVAAVVPPPPPIAVATVGLSAPVASDRSTLSGTVGLSAPVPSGSTIQVSLACDVAAVSVPSSLTIAAGSATAPFALVVGDLSAAGTATVTATLSYTSASTTLALSPYHPPYVPDPSNSLTTALQALYLFCEGSGTVLHDFSGNAHHIPAPASMWRPTPYLGSAALDGSFGLSASLPYLPKYPLTLALVGSRPAASNTYMATLADDAGHGYTGIRDDGGTLADAALDDAAVGFKVSPYTPQAAGTWHSYVLVIEAARFTFYVDGAAVGAPVALSTPPTGRVVGLYLGGAQGGNRATAQISVAALATRAWSAAEVAAFAAAPVALALALAARPPAPRRIHWPGRLSPARATRRFS